MHGQIAALRQQVDDLKRAEIEIEQEQPKPDEWQVEIVA